MMGAVVTTGSVVAGFIVFLVLLLTYAWAPRGYACEGRTLIVRRLIGDLAIPLDSLREARAAQPDDFRGCLRLWGSGGVFGYFGLFRTSKLGKCSWYATHRKNMVVIVTAAKTALVSPDDVAGFLEAIGPVAQATSAASVPAPEASRPLPIGMIAGVVLGLAGLAFVAFMMTYSPGPPRCTLNAQSLKIDDLFYPVTIQAADVDVARIRVVDLAADADWRLVARTNGFANSHYRSGWFRLAGGRKVRLYRASATRLVLLPPRGDGAPVLLETADPDAFAAELQRLWSR